MGIFDGMKTNKMGQKAYNAHVQANELNKRGRVAESKAKFEEARKLYEEAYDAGCRRSNIMMAYAVLLMRLGEFAKARELMKEVSAIGGLTEDSHFELRVNYSICLWRLGLLDEAIKTIVYAGKHKKNGTYYSSLGTYLVEQAGQTGEFEAARELLEEAMDYDDEDPATLDNYGEYYRLLSERAVDASEKAKLRDQAKDYFERAHAQKPSQITTLYALAKLEKEDGNLERARELTDKAIVHTSSKICPVTIEQLQALKAELD